MTGTYSITRVIVRSATTVASAPAISTRSEVAALWSGPAVTAVVSQGCQLQQPPQLSQFSSSIELKGWRNRRCGLSNGNNTKSGSKPTTEKGPPPTRKVLRFFTVSRNQSAPPPPASRAAHELHANCLSERSACERTGTPLAAPETSLAAPGYRVPPIALVSLQSIFSEATVVSWRGSRSSYERESRCHSVCLQ